MNPTKRIARNWGKFRLFLGKLSGEEAQRVGFLADLTITKNPAGDWGCVASFSHVREKEKGPSFA